VLRGDTRGALPRLRGRLGRTLEGALVAWYGARLVISIVCAAETCGNGGLARTIQRDFGYRGSAHKVNSLSRTWIATKRWVIRGSRLLSGFPVLIR
jgi:hypothetical protein